MELPDSPWDNVRTGSDYLRLTGDCPTEGIILSLRGSKKVTNERFGKEEYSWDAVVYTPYPREVILTESSKGFCTAIGKISKDFDYLSKHPLLIKWVKEEISGGRQAKRWMITEVQPHDIAKLQQAA